MPFPKFLLVGGFMFSVAITAQAQVTTCPQHFADGVAPDIVQLQLRDKVALLCYEAFAVEHSGAKRIPLWSAEHLTIDSLRRAKLIPRHDDFHPDEHLSPADRAELSDYKKSGYDRGHMSPSGDMPTTTSQDESFTLANIIPQNRNNNENLWEGIEAAVRTLTFSRGELFIITGPVIDPSRAYVERLKDRVVVPTGVFKAVYDPAAKKAAAYLVQNRDGMEYQTVSIAELEKLIGMNVFPKMPAAIKLSKMDLPAPTPHSEGRPQGEHGHRKSFR